MPGPVEATSSTLEVAHEDKVWNKALHTIKQGRDRILLMLTRAENYARKSPYWFAHEY